eukprot:COSAG05_NODE_10905_length_540_cov_0.696145_2_plen_79_part_00
MAVMDEDGSGEVDFGEFFDWWVTRNDAVAVIDGSTAEAVENGETGGEDGKKKLKKMAPVIKVDIKDTTETADFEIVPF